MRRRNLVLMILALFTVGCTPTFLTRCGGGGMGRMEAGVGEAGTKTFSQDGVRDRGASGPGSAPARGHAYARVDYLVANADRPEDAAFRG